MSIFSNFGRRPAISASKGTHLANLESLIRAAREQLKEFAEGRTEFIGYVTALRQQMQYCLADVGQDAKEELRELATMDLSISEGLRGWYKKGVYDDTQVKEGDPSDFLRLQKEYDETTPPKIQRMIKLLEQMRNKLLGLAPASAGLVKPFATPEGSTWDDVTIRFTSDFNVQISVCNRTEVRTHSEMGFEDRRGKRTSKPDRNWDYLCQFAEHDGAIQSTQDAADWRKLEKAVQAINRRLKILFGLSGHPIMYDRKGKCYKATFKLIGPPGNGDLDSEAD